MAEAKESEELLKMYDAKVAALEEKFKAQGMDLEKLREEELSALAKSAEMAERWQHMVLFMQHYIKKRLKKLEDDKFTEPPLDEDNRNLLSVAHKSVVGKLRNAWRATSIDSEEEIEANGLGAVVNKDMIKTLQKHVGQDLRAECLKVQETLTALADAEQKVMKNNEPDKEQPGKEKIAWIFYKKMSADYYRYLQETYGKDEAGYKKQCDEAYEAAWQAAKSLEPTNPVRLGLALNYAVCKFEILGQKEKACELAKQSFDDAIEKLDSLSDHQYKDSTLIMQLLRDNLTIWSTDNNEDAEAE